MILALRALSDRPLSLDTTSLYKDLPVNSPPRKGGGVFHTKKGLPADDGHTITIRSGVLKEID